MFLKKVLVLKKVENYSFSFSKPFSGIARIEIESGVAEFYLSLVNSPFISNAQFFALVCDKLDGNYFFPLGARPVSSMRIFETCPCIDDGLAIGIYAVKDDIPLTLAFARSDDTAISLSQFKKIVAERCISQRKNKPAKEEPTNSPFPNPSPIKPPYPPAPEPDPKITPPDEFNSAQPRYDDEAVATANYYEFDKEICDKLSIIKEFDNESLRTENELLNPPGEEETAKEHLRSDCAQDETNDCECKNNSQRDCPAFYNTVKAELNNLFEKFQAEEDLQKIFNQSRWARINYSNEKYYVVGVIKENDVEKYICYGVPATFSPTPPKELEGFCSFVPRSIFNMTGKGYWMMFQDAVSGKCIKHEN